MNRLSFERYIYLPEGHDRPKDEEEVVPIIDGVPLHEMVGDRLPGLGLSFVAPPSRQWLGAPSYQEEGRAVILDGSCGFAGCCGVFARITLTDDTVRWSNFFARGRPPLPPGLAFEFDRPSYEAAITSVTMAPERIWTTDEDDEL